jgi:3-deoxy-D-manno-octulosonic-acid transferase
MQVSGKLELEKALFSDAKVLEARCTSAKQAFHALSSGIVANVWNLLNSHVLKGLFARSKCSLACNTSKCDG